MFERRIEIRWSDLDAYAHVYHPVYLSFLEAARDQWLRRIFELDGRVWDYLVVRVAIDYRGALDATDTAAVVRCRLRRIGRSSLTTMEEVLAPDGRVAAEAEVVLVAWDPESGRSRPLSEGERSALERELDNAGGPVDEDRA
jgi:acyl-CoA thioester hydrolase